MGGAGCEGCCGGGGSATNCERHTTTVHTGSRGSVSRTSPCSAHTRAKGGRRARSREAEREREREKHHSTNSMTFCIGEPPPPRRKPLWTWVDSFHPTLLQSECSEILKPPNKTSPWRMYSVKRPGTLSLSSLIAWRTERQNGVVSGWVGPPRWPDGVRRPTPGQDLEVSQ